MYAPQLASTHGLQAQMDVFDLRRKGWYIADMEQEVGYATTLPLLVLRGLGGCESVS